MVEVAGFSGIHTRTLADGHAVLVSSDVEWAYTLTPIGALIWEFCDGTNTAEEIQAKIEAIPDLQVGANLKKEVVSFLEELECAGLLEEVE